MKYLAGPLGLLAVLAFALFAAARGAEPPPRPELIEELDGMPDCPRSFELTPGKKWSPPNWLLDEDGVIQCRAVAEPYTSLADLLKIETAYNELRGQYRVDTETHEQISRHWQERALVAEEALRQPPPFWEQRSVAAWQGRLEMAAAVAFAAWGLGQLADQ